MTGERNSWGVTLFCDDIRQEVAGKNTLVGVYHVDMVFPVDVVFPIAYPRLAIFVTYYEITQKFSDDLTLTVYLHSKEAETTLHSMNFQRSSVIASPPVDMPFLDERETERVNIVRYPLVLSPLLVPSECVLKVRMLCGDTTTKLGVLKIRKQHPDDNIKFS
jgi:hypothetical protein